MKTITIGRSHDCTVTIKDTSDTVSRKQASIACSFWGGMRIYDLSKNGTIVNGKRLVKPEGMKVKRGDKVVFGNDTPLDWSVVPHPYRTAKIVIACILGIIILASIILSILYYNGVFTPEPGIAPLTDEDIISTQVIGI